MKLDRLSRSFGETKALREITLEFPQTGLYAVTGPSGQGKTTLLRILAGLDHGYAGQLLDVPPAAMCFQEYRLFPQLTALKNAAAFSNEQSAARVLTALKLTPEQQHLLPAALSGGMKQRVALARALTCERPLLLLDEPFKELDAALREKALSLIEQEGQRRLVLLTAHDLSGLSSPAWHAVTLDGPPAL